MAKEDDLQVLNKVASKVKDSLKVKIIISDLSMTCVLILKGGCV